MSIEYKSQAIIELFFRYKNIFDHHWKLRNKNPLDLFTVDEANFLPGALSLQEKPVSRTARICAVSLLSILLFSLLWSCFGKMDIVVNAPGKVVASGSVKSIASVEIAVVKFLHVREGQLVKKGDLLVELDANSADTDYLKASGVVSEASLQVARAEALLIAIENRQEPILNIKFDVAPFQLKSARNQLDAQYADFRNKLKRVDDDIIRYSKLLPFATRRAADYRELSKNSDVSIHTWQEKEQARIEIVGQLNDAVNQRSALVSQTRKETWDTLSDGRKTIAASTQDARRASSHSNLFKLLAPVDGTVQQLNIHTIGGVVPAAQTLMVIVPNDKKFEIEAFIENRDIGFVREGQQAFVKVDAFDYAKYGTLSARVVQISRDAIQDEKRGLIYSAKVSLDEFKGVDRKNMASVFAGLSVNVEMKTGERRVIEYFLSPVMQHKREALTER